MSERVVTVASRVGLHARPAATFVKAANSVGADVTISKDGTDPVSARSILAVLSLDVRNGDQVTLAAAGDNADAALDSLAALLATDLEG